MAMGQFPGFDTINNNLNLIIRAINNLGTSIVDALGSVPLTSSATWNPGSIADGDMESVDVTCTGATLGYRCTASFSLDVQDLVISSAVTAADTVTVTLANNTGGAVNLASGTVKVWVWLT